MCCGLTKMYQISFSGGNESAHHAPKLNFIYSQNETRQGEPNKSRDLARKEMAKGPAAQVETADLCEQLCEWSNS